MKTFQILILFLIHIQVFSQTKVAVIDSNLFATVYDSEVYNNYGSNATEIKFIIDEMNNNIVARVYNTNVFWLNMHNVNLVLQYSPDLVIIHTSAFYDPNNPMSTEIYDRLIYFIGALSSNTKIVIYSRNYYVQGGKNGLREIILLKKPHLTGRIHLIDIQSFTNSEGREIIQNTINTFMGN